MEFTKDKLRSELALSFHARGYSMEIARICSDVCADRQDYFDGKTKCDTTEMVETFVSDHPELIDKKEMSVSYHAMLNKVYEEKESALKNRRMKKPEDVEQGDYRSMVHNLER